MLGRDACRRLRVRVNGHSGSSKPRKIEIAQHKQLAYSLPRVVSISIVDFRLVNRFCCVRIVAWELVKGMVMELTTCDGSRQSLYHRVSKASNLVMTKVVANAGVIHGCPWAPAWLREFEGPPRMVEESDPLLRDDSEKLLFFHEAVTNWQGNDDSQWKKRQRHSLLKTNAQNKSNYLQGKSSGSTTPERQPLITNHPAVETH